MPSKKADINIFIAYAREDAAMLKKLRKQLKVLERTKNIHIWYDGLINVGQYWEQEIKDALHNADIILLLISSDFLASDYCYENEMTTALELHQQGNVRTVPIILRECLWKDTPFATLQALPQDGVPVTSKVWETTDQPYVHIAKELKKIIVICPGKQYLHILSYLTCLRSG